MNELKEKKWTLSREQKTWGLTAFIVICFGVLFFFIVYRWQGVAGGFSNVRRVFEPFILGAVLAWLLVPVYNMFERTFYPIFSKKGHERGKRRTKLVCTLLTLLLTFAVIYAFFAMILPGLIQSVSTIINNSDKYLETVTGWGEKFLENNPTFADLFEKYSKNISDYIVDWSRTKLLPGLTSMLGALSGKVIGVFRFLLNFIIGVVACVYILNARRTLAAQAKRITYSVFGAKNANTVINATNFVDRVFSEFLSGKAWDSLLIGLICFICCTIMRIPYTLLVSVIVGVTNIIPFFGPFIGAIPSALLILVDSPIKALYFAVFIIILQQVDGNIIGPKILGESVGLSPLWILVSITVFGGFFGFWGMLLGIPVFTCIYTLVRWLIQRSLAKKGLPVETETYRTVKSIDPETKEIEKKDPYRPERKTQSILKHDIFGSKKEKKDEEPKA